MKFLIETSDSENFIELKRVLKRFQNKTNEVTNLKDQQLISIRTDLGISEIGSLLKIPTGKIQVQKRERQLDYLPKFEILNSKDRGEYFEESSTEKSEGESIESQLNTTLQKLTNSLSEAGKNLKGKKFDISSELKELNKQDNIFLNSPKMSKDAEYIKKEQLSTLSAGDVTMNEEPKNEKNQGVSKSNSVMVSQIKLDAKTSVPIWHSSPDPTQNQVLLDNYLADLKRVKKLNIFENDQVLIFSSVNSSNKTHIFNELPTEAQDNLDKFSEYVRKAYGRSYLKIRQGLANLEQFPSESIYTFFYRTINTYYRARDSEPKGLNEIDNNAVERNDIVYYFVKGLKDENVRKTVRTQLINIDFKKLPESVKNLSELVASNEADKMQVNTISSKPMIDLQNELKELSSTLKQVLIVQKPKPYFKKFQPNNKRSKYYTSQRPMSRYKKETRKCYKCGKQGHLIKDCYAKDRK